jgi:hypothetical protein
MPKRGLSAVLWLALALTAASCATMAQLDTAGLSKGPLVPGRSFKIIPANAMADSHSLIFGLASDYLGRALKKRGLVPAAEDDSPDLIVKLAFGYEKPVTKAMRIGDSETFTHFFPLKIVISAREAGQEAWRTELLCYDPQHDIRAMLPKMFAVSVQDLGADIEPAKVEDFDPGKIVADTILPK